MMPTLEEKLDGMTAWVERLQEELRDAKADKLRAGEGSAVTIECDNADFNGLPNCAIDVVDDWTGWEPVTFRGDTVASALSAALTARQKASASAEAPAPQRAGETTASVGEREARDVLDLYATHDGEVVGIRASGSSMPVRLGTGANIHTLSAAMAELAEVIDRVAAGATRKARWERETEIINELHLGGFPVAALFVARTKGAALRADAGEGVTR